MNKQELDVLEKAFSAQISPAGGLGIIQTKSKVAKSLAERGYLENVVATLPGTPKVTVSGYALTINGNFEYCSSDRCKNAESEL